MDIATPLGAEETTLTDETEPSWTYFRWGDLYLRTREPDQRGAPVELWVPDERAWRPSDLAAAGLRAIDAERLSPDEARRLGLTDPDAAV